MLLLVESVSVRRNRVADELRFQQRQRQRSNAGQCVLWWAWASDGRSLDGIVKLMLLGGVAGRKAGGSENGEWKAWHAGRHRATGATPPIDSTRRRQ